MEVTKDNFSEVFPVVEEAVEKCTYYAFDLEMSGVQLESSDKYDLVEDRYQQIQQCAREFLVLQFGLATFAYDSKTNSFEAKCFNFYLFPRLQKVVNMVGNGVIGSGTSNSTFQSQLSSIEFLAEEGFDFSKCFKNGVSFVQLRKKDALIKSAQTNLQRQKYVAIVSEEDKRYVADLKSKLKNWINSKEKVLVLSRATNTHQRNLQQMVVEKFQENCRNRQDTSFYIDKEGDDSGHISRYRFVQLRCVKVNRKQAALMGDQSRSERMKAIEEATMFCDVVRLLIECKKPMIGHNALLDLAFTIQSFYRDLPQVWPVFKDIVRKECFPAIYDTKYLVEQCRGLDGSYQHSSLQEVYQGLVEMGFESHIMEMYKEARIEYEKAPLPSIHHSKGYTRYNNSAKENTQFSRSFQHEAGYDAYMTGASFACLARILELQAYINGDLKDVRYVLTLRGALLYTGRMLLPRSDYPYVDMSTDDPQPDRGNILYLHDIDKSMKATEVLARLRAIESNCRFSFLKQARKLESDGEQEGLAFFPSEIAAKFTMEKLKEDPQNFFKVEVFEYYKVRRQLSSLNSSQQKGFLRMLQNQSLLQNSDDEIEQIDAQNQTSEDQQQSDQEQERGSDSSQLLEKPERQPQRFNCFFQ